MAEEFLDSDVLDRMLLMDSDVDPAKATVELESTYISRSSLTLEYATL